MYALQMAYFAGVNGTALAVTNAAAVPVAVVCNTSVPLRCASQSGFNRHP